MTGMAHEAPRPARSSAVIAAWAVLVGMGGTSVTYNVYHAVHHGSMNLGLALLYGIAPVFAAALLSHIVAEHDGGKFLQAVTFAVMLGAMTLSIGATAAVVKPAAGPWMQWLFGAVLDAAALVALRVILTGRKRKAEAAEAMEAAGHVRAEAERVAAEAAGSVAEAEGKAAEAAERTALLEAELATTKAALEAVRTAGPPSRSRRSPKGGPKPARTAPPDDLALEAKALELLAGDLSMSGAELARKLGVTDSYGRKLRRRLTERDRLRDETADRSSESAEDRAQDRP